MMGSGRARARRPGGPKRFFSARTGSEPDFFQPDPSLRSEYAALHVSPKQKEHSVEKTVFFSISCRIIRRIKSDARKL